MWQRMLQGGGTASKEIVELVLPYMTSNTNAVGTAIENDNSTTNTPYLAFDHNDDTYTGCVQSLGWTGFSFYNPVCVKSVSFLPYDNTRVHNYVIEADNEPTFSNPKVIASGNYSKASGLYEEVDTSSNETYYKCYRVRSTSTQYAYTMRSVKFLGYKQ